MALSEKELLKLINSLDVKATDNESSEELSDETETELKEVESAPQFRIEISEDRMTAWFHLYETDPPSDPNIHEVISELKELGLTKYDITAVEIELLHPSYSPVIIAKGINPVPSTDASLELLFKEQIESSFEEVNGQIDFRNHLKIPSAQQGEIIARKKPAQMGTPGIDIFGNLVKPEPPKDIILIAKKHIQITPEGEVIALKEGRPRITGNRIKFIEINPFHIVPNDVDLKTGNIFFSGDIMIYGNVTDGMIVEALGNVYVSGSVFNATITATGSILIKGNIIGGKLYSGHFGVLYNRLYNHSKKLNETLQTFKQSANLLMEALTLQNKHVPIGQAYQLLADSKFKEIQVTTKEVLSCIATIQNIQRNYLDQLKNKLSALLLPSCFLNTDPVPFLTNLQQMLIETFESIKRCEETTVQMDIPKCQLSTVMSNGDIYVRKEGVLQCTLYSKNNIIFYQKDAVCKGSQLEAGDSITAMVVGGMSGGASTLKAGKRIFAQKIYDGRIFIKRFSKEIMEPTSNVQFFVNQNRLVIQNDL